MHFIYVIFLYLHFRTTRKGIKTKGELKCMIPTSVKHKSDNGYKKYMCEDCGYATNTRYNLSNHRQETCKVLRKLGQLKPPDEQCKYCLKPVYVFSYG